MEENITGLIIGGIAGFAFGHIFAAIFGIRSKDTSGMPSPILAIACAVIGAIAGFVFGIKI